MPLVAEPKHRTRQVESFSLTTPIGRIELEPEPDPNLLVLTVKIFQSFEAF
jgi:hypothetical protein